MITVLNKFSQYCEICRINKLLETIIKKQKQKDIYRRSAITVITLQNYSTQSCILRNISKYAHLNLCLVQINPKQVHFEPKLHSNEPRKANKYFECYISKLYFIFRNISKIFSQYFEIFCDVFQNICILKYFENFCEVFWYFYISKILVNFFANNFAVFRKFLRSFSKC